MANIPDPSLSLPPVGHQSAVEVANVGKVYGVRPVLRGISFSVPTGVSLALLGPNGAGKTTLLRALATLTTFTTGTASILGLDLRADAAQIRHIIGYVGHQPHLYDELTASENLLFFARMYGLPDGPRRTTELLERVGLRLKTSDRVRTLSRGQVQRLALARGILHDPAVLLLDEPDTGLDEDAAALLQTIINERQQRGQTTLFTTHQLDRALSLSTQSVVLVNGRLVYAGPAADLTPAEVRALYATSKRRTP
jgi:heme ABC exporter ATP-binding subunit CcmA